MFQEKPVEKIKTHILYSNFFFRKSCRLLDNWKNTVQCSRPQMAIWRMRIACRLPKATNTHTQVVWYALLFHCNSGCTNAPQCYVIRAYIHCPSCSQYSYICFQILSLRRLKPHVKG